MHEIALREAAVPTSEVIKPKRKRRNTEKIITSAFFFMAAIACIYYRKIPLKRGHELSMDNQPFLFWVTLLVLGSLALHQLLTLDTKHIKTGAANEHSRCLAWLMQGDMPPSFSKQWID